MYFNIKIIMLAMN